jgi:light-regulated signal transduction histidine kinase (bacteriophytochrome)
MDLNEVIGVIMKRFQSSLGKNKVIARCEMLPVVEANKQQMTKAFDNLINIILSSSASGANLFLSINCNEESSLIKLNIDSKSNYKNYIISFYTNIQANKEWECSNLQRITECKHLIESNSGSFSMNYKINSGCSFYITLPGKLR